MPELYLVAQVDMLVQLPEALGVHLLRHRNLLGPGVEHVPEDELCMLRAELFADDLLELDHPFLEEQPEAIERLEVGHF